MKKVFPLLIRLLWCISILSVIMLLAIVVVKDSTSGSESWKPLTLLEHGSRTAIPKAWVYSEGKGELYCTDKLMYCDDYTLYMTVVHGDEEKKESFDNTFLFQDGITNRLLGELNDFQSQPSDFDAIEAKYHAGTVSFTHNKIQRESFYYELNYSENLYYLISWDGDIQYELMDNIVGHYFFR